MEYLYDPLRASYRYERSTYPVDLDIEVTHGGLYLDGKLCFSTWPIDATADVFEADPCSCGVEGCGLYDVHAHRSGPFLVWTCWERRNGQPHDLGDLPLIFSAESYQRALGGSTHALPWMDGVHAARLLEEAIWTGGLRQDECWWWDQGPDEIDPGALVRRLAALSPPDLEGASLVSLPQDAWLAYNEAGAGFRAAAVEGALAVQAGQLTRFPVALRIPSLGSSGGAHST